MSIERDLISKILVDRDLTDVTDAGITFHFFQTQSHRRAFQAILDHHREYGVVPSIESFQRDFPAETYRLTEPDEPARYYCDELSRDYEAYLIEDGLVKATDLFEVGDVEAAKQEIAKTLMAVNREVSKVKAVDLTVEPEKRVERYRTYARSEGALKGVSTGFETIDFATGGMQGGQLFTFVGPPKAGKSTMMLLSAMNAHKSFYRPLFIGFEMSNEEQEERHDAIRAGVSHTKLRDGRLTGDDFRHLEKMSRRLTNMPSIIFSADSSSSSTLSGVAGLIDKYEPDVVYIDGVYMMEDENGEKKGSPQALTNLSRGLKRMAQNTNLPVAISTQVLTWKMDRKRGVTTSSIGYASSFGQDSDVLIGVEPTDDPVMNKVKILDGRNVKRMEFFVMWDWETGEFTEVEREEVSVEDDEEAATRF